MIKTLKIINCLLILGFKEIWKIIGKVNRWIFGDIPVSAVMKFFSLYIVFAIILFSYVIYGENYGIDDIITMVFPIIIYTIINIDIRRETKELVRKRIQDMNDIFLISYILGYILTISKFQYLIHLDDLKYMIGLSSGLDGLDRVMDILVFSLTIVVIFFISMSIYIQISKRILKSEHWKNEKSPK